LKIGIFCWKSPLLPRHPRYFSGLGHTLYTYGNHIISCLGKKIARKKVKKGILIFGVQLGLNVLWSFLFFGLKSSYYAFVEIILLWLAIFLTILKFREISKMASYLLFPYILWVSFAALLNYYLWILNS
jgi:tryptophan-rich sensory protein